MSWAKVSVWLAFLLRENPFYSDITLDRDGETAVANLAKRLLDTIQFPADESAVEAERGVGQPEQVPFFPLLCSFLCALTSDRDHVLHLH